MRAEDAEHGLAQPTNLAFLAAVVRPLVPSDMADGDCRTSPRRPIRRAPGTGTRNGEPREALAQARGRPGAS